MNRYVIELHGCVEVEAQDKWEAFDKAYEAVENGELEYAEPEVVECERIPEERISHARRVPTPTHMMAVPMIASPYKRNPWLE